MKQREFGNNGFTTSEIGLGTWQLGGSDWGDVDDHSALQTLKTAVDKNITFIDTADVYGLGHSEQLIGKFLKQAGNKVTIATKLGRYPEPGGDANFSLDTFRSHTEASIQRLGVDCIDLMQLHCIPTEQLQKGDVFDWLRELQQEGKIRHFGVSVETVEEAELCLQQDGVASLQVIFNIFRQKPIGFFEKAKDKGVALIVRLPLASGLLSGKLTKNSTFAENDHRNFNREGQLFNIGETFAGLPFEKGVALSNELKSYVPDNMTLPQMALRWILDFDAVSVVIPGASHPAQVQQNAEVSKLPPLDKKLHQQLKLFYEKEVAEHIQGVY